MFSMHRKEDTNTITLEMIYRFQYYADLEAIADIQHNGLVLFSDIFISDR